MLPQLGSEEEYQHRFIQEAKMATRLKHPNVGTIHDFAVDPDGTAYIVMEYIDGVNLAELLRTSGPPGLPLTLEIAHQTLLALGYLHRKNVVHRDIALDNLMLTHDEEDRPQIKLIDLGISKALDKTIELTSRGVFLGKLKYSSPEQLGSLGPEETLDGRSDLYSLGVVLYELLTGRPPLGGDTPRTLIGAHLFHPPTPFSETDPGGKVPTELRALVMKALEKKRTDRFASAEELDQAVLRVREQIATGETEPAHKLLSRVRATRDAVPVQITPSAQNRLDRQFIAQTTPGPTPYAVKHPSGRIEEDAATVVDPRSTAEALPLVRKPRRALVAALVAATIAAAAAILFVGREKTADAPAEAVATPIPIETQAPGAAITEMPSDTAEPTAPAAELELPPTAPFVAETAPPADTTRLRRIAEQSRARVSSARETAERAGAPQRAEEIYDQARRKQREAESLIARGEFERSITAVPGRLGSVPARRVGRAGAPPDARGERGRRAGAGSPDADGGPPGGPDLRPGAGPGAHGRTDRPPPTLRRRGGRREDPRDHPPVRPGAEQPGRRPLRQRLSRHRVAARGHRERLAQPPIATSRGRDPADPDHRLAGRGAPLRAARCGAPGRQRAAGQPRAHPPPREARRRLGDRQPELGVETLDEVPVSLLTSHPQKL